MNNLNEDICHMLRFNGWHSNFIIGRPIIRILALILAILSCFWGRVSPNKANTGILPGIRPPLRLPTR
jgi:hypothetical protein